MILYSRPPLVTKLVDLIDRSVFYWSIIFVIGLFVFRYVKILESWLEKVDVVGSEMKETSENIVVKKIKLIHGRVKKDVIFEGNGGSSVIVPAEALAENMDNKTRHVNESIYFVYYKRNTFFNREKKQVSVSCKDGFTLEERRVFTTVLASSIIGRDVKNLSKPITLKFKARPGKEVSPAKWLAV